MDFGNSQTTRVTERIMERIREHLKREPRHWRRGPSIPLETYLTNPDVLVIYASDITPAERVGDVPTQGYVWQG